MGLLTTSFRLRSPLLSIAFNSKSISEAILPVEDDLFAGKAKCRWRTLEALSEIPEDLFQKASRKIREHVSKGIVGSAPPTPISIGAVYHGMDYWRDEIPLCRFWIFRSPCLCTGVATNCLAVPYATSQSRYRQTQHEPRPTITSCGKLIMLPRRVCCRSAGRYWNPGPSRVK
jgi:hypothetical protein